MNCLISSSCDPSNERLDACDHKPSLCTGDGGFAILGEPAIATEPGEGALDHPSPGQELEALRGIGTLDDLQCPLAKLLQRLLELRSGKIAFEFEHLLLVLFGLKRRARVWRVRVGVPNVDRTVDDMCM